MIHRALKLARQFHRLTQSETADRLGVSKSFLSEIESGKKTPTLDLLDKYAKEFGIPASTLLLFVENSEHPAEAAKQRPARKILKFLEWASDEEIERDGKARTVKSN
jgi:transcriptional regulator with XRE-family HTH domain